MEIALHTHGVLPIGAEPSCDSIFREVTHPAGYQELCKQKTRLRPNSKTSKHAQELSLQDFEPAQEASVPEVGVLNFLFFRVSEHFVLTVLREAGAALGKQLRTGSVLLDALTRSRCLKFAIL